jgi:dTMP kinase
MTAPRKKPAPRKDAAVLVPKVTPKRFYGHGIPGVEPSSLTGKLVVVEGADGSGRSTQQGNILSRATLSLFYATDFADQLENTILPALRSGSIVLADRYIYTLMARDLVRGSDEAWLRNLYGIALVPDAVFYLEVAPEQLVQRVFAKNQSLDYWESGMDLGLSRDMFDSFLRYQGLMRDTFRRLQQTYGFRIVDGDRPAERIHRELQEGIEDVLLGR